MGGFIPAKALPIIRASGSQLATTTNAQTVATYTPSVNGFYRISGWVDCTAFTAGTIGAVITYTDGNSVAHTNIGLSALSATSPGANVLTLGGVGSLNLITLTIYAKAATAITVATAIGTATADFFAIIEQVG